MVKISINHGINEKGVAGKGTLVSEYLKKIKNRGQGFYDLIDQDFDGRIKEKYDDVVVLGIGGSALGAICLKDTLKPNARLHVLDNIDPSFIKDVEEKINLEKTLFVVVSKSGDTVETLSQYKYFKEKGAKHFVFITDSEKGELRRIANREGIQSFDVPSNVGGRFSALTPVGLVPSRPK